MFVITGGGRGIGKALALALAARNQSVLIVGRHEDTLKQVSGCSAVIEYFEADVSTADGRQRIAERLKSFGTLHGLVHNAGIIEPIMPITEMNVLQWRQVMSTNVEAPLFLTQQLLCQLKGGRVLHIGSGAAYFPVVGWSAYCVSKAALSMLTRCWQMECPDPLIASVMPGIVDTDMAAEIRQAKAMTPEKLDFFKHLKQQDQLLQPESVALFLTWLLLDVDQSAFTANEWDIYDTSHHAFWLPATHRVPPLV